MIIHQMITTVNLTQFLISSCIFNFLEYLDWWQLSLPFHFSAAFYGIFLFVIGNNTQSY